MFILKKKKECFVWLNIENDQQVKKNFNERWQLYDIWQLYYGFNLIFKFYFVIKRYKILIHIETLQTAHTLWNLKSDLNHQEW